MTAFNRPQIKADTLVGGIAMLLALTVVQRLIGFARSVLFCRWLDADQLGQWDLAYGFLMLSAPLAVLGLPGSLGRYIEHYRRHGQIKLFLRRVSGGTLLAALVAVATIAVGRTWFSRMLFRDDDQAGFVALLAVVLAAWVVHLLLVAIFNALRMTRAVSVLQFCHSLAFASIGVALLAAFDANAISVVWSFAAATACSSLVGLAWLASCWRSLPEDGAPEWSAGDFSAQPARAIWRQVVPFALWVWITNALANLFGLADRWMIVQFSGLSEAAALAQLGQYHSARVVPLLFLGVAEMVAGQVTPHLAQDWEAGRREDVSHRLNLILKLFALCLFAAGAVLLVAAPLLFGWALAGRYAAGMSLLPWTLMYCTWGSLAVVATNYLWCAERARLASLALAVGLFVNVALGAWLLPRYGLWGVVWGTSAANFLMLAAICAAAWRSGMRCDLGVCLSALAPLALPVGQWAALGALALLAILSCRGGLLFSAAEQRRFANTWHRLSASLRRRRLAGARS